MTKEIHNDSDSSLRDPHLFQTFWKKEVEEFALGVSFEEYKNIVQTLENQPSTSKKLYNIHKASFVSEILQDIDHVWEICNFENKYNEITKLITESKEKPDKITWRPITGDYEYQLKAYRIKGLKEKRKKLKEMVQNQNQIKQLTQKQFESKQKLIKEQLTTISKAKSKLDAFYKVHRECLEENGTKDNS